MAVNRQFPTEADDGPTMTGPAFATANAEEGEALWDRITDYLTSAAGTNTYTASASITLTAYADGQSFWWVCPNTNTSTSCTMNINSVGAGNILDADGNAVAVGDLVAGRMYKLLRWSSAFRVVSGMSEGLARAIGPVAIFGRSLSQGTDGGAATSGSRQTYPLNVTHVNQIGASLNAGTGRFTLPPGTWKLRGVAVFEDTDGVKLTFHNTTDTADIDGVAAQLDLATASQYGIAEALAVVTLTASKEIELQYECDTTSATEGLGRANSFDSGTSEKYGFVEVQGIHPTGTLGTQPGNFEDLLGSPYTVGSAVASVEFPFTADRYSEILLVASDISGSGSAAAVATLRNSGGAIVTLTSGTSQTAAQFGSYRAVFGLGLNAATRQNFGKLNGAANGVVITQVNAAGANATPADRVRLAFASGNVDAGMIAAYGRVK